MSDTFEFLQRGSSIFSDCRKLHAPSLLSLIFSFFSLMPVVGVFIIPIALITGIRAFVYLGMHPEYYGKRFLLLAFIFCFGGVLVTTQTAVEVSEKMTQIVARQRGQDGFSPAALSEIGSLFLGGKIGFEPTRAAGGLSGVAGMLYPKRILSKAVKAITGGFGAHADTLSAGPSAGPRDMSFSEQEAFISQIEQLAGAKKYQDIINVCNVYLMRFNENMLLVWQKAEALKKSGSTERALHTYGRALELAGKEDRRAMVIWITKARGELYAASGNYAAARADFERVVALKKDMLAPEDQVLVGAMHSRLGSYDKAAACFAAAEALGLPVDKQEERIETAPGIFRVTRYQPDGRMRDSRIERVQSKKTRMNAPRKTAVRPARSKRILNDLI